MNKVIETKSSERGGAGAKLLLVIVVFALIGNAGYQFIPIAYSGETLKQDMHSAVLQGLSMPGKAGSLEAVKQKIQSSVLSNNLPSDAFVEVKQIKTVIQARVAFTKDIPILPFGIYTYHYQFDHTSSPGGFLAQ